MFEKWIKFSKIFINIFYDLEWWTEPIFDFLTPWERWLSSLSIQMKKIWIGKKMNEKFSKKYLILRGFFKFQSFWRHCSLSFWNTNHYSVFFFACPTGFVHTLITVRFIIVFWWIAFVFAQLMDGPSSIRSNEKVFFLNEKERKFSFIFTWQ